MVQWFVAVLLRLSLNDWKNSEKNYEVIFFKMLCDSLQSMYERHGSFTVHEIYVVELVRELLGQFRGKSSFVFVFGIYIPAVVIFGEQGKVF